MLNELPRGTAAWLPEDLARLRALEGRVRAAFEGRGFREVKTPAFEYAEVVATGIGAEMADRLFRMTDVTGRALALRPEMTTPCARLFAATIAPQTEGPVRLYYVADVWRQQREFEGSPREIRQAGVEIFRVPSPAGDAEAVETAVEALEAAGLRRFQIEVGHAGLVRSFSPSEADLDALHRKDAAALPPALAPLARLFGGPEVLDAAAGLSSEGAFRGALDDLRAVYEATAPAARSRIAFDLAVVRRLAYYDAVVFEFLVPGAGRPVGGGGRYDGLTAAFGSAAPATGFSVDLEALSPIVDL